MCVCENSWESAINTEVKTPKLPYLIDEVGIWQTETALKPAVYTLVFVLLINFTTWQPVVLVLRPVGKKLSRET